MIKEQLVMPMHWQVNKKWMIHQTKLLKSASRRISLMVKNQLFNVSREIEIARSIHLGEVE